jgi:hypothetical protein
MKWKAFGSKLVLEHHDRGRLTNSTMHFTDNLCSAELLDHPALYSAIAPTWPDTYLKIVLEHTTKPHVLGLMIKLWVCQQAVQGTINIRDGLQKKSAKQDSSRRL